MKVNDRHCSFYYEEDDEYMSVAIDPRTTALVIIDMQRYFLDRPSPSDSLSAAEQAHDEAWASFYDETERVTVPACSELLRLFRSKEMPVCHARITSQRSDGTDRSLCEREPGFNDLLLPVGDASAEIIDELSPIADELVFMKTTDSVVTGTNIAMLLRNMGIDTVVVCGIFTDQCVSSSVRTFADESFKVWLVEDATMAATHQIKEAELTILNNIYCHVITTHELKEAL